MRVTVKAGAVQILTAFCQPFTQSRDLAFLETGGTGYLTGISVAVHFGFSGKQILNAE